MKRPPKIILKLLPDPEATTDRVWSQVPHTHRAFVFNGVTFDEIYSSELDAPIKKFVTSDDAYDAVNKALYNSGISLVYFHRLTGHGKDGEFIAAYGFTRADGADELSETDEIEGPNLEQAKRTVLDSGLKLINTVDTSGTTFSGNNPIIAIGHRKGVGKSTLGNLLRDYLGLPMLPLFWEIKSLVTSMFGYAGIERPDFYEDNYVAKATPLQLPNHPSVRDLWVKFGIWLREIDPSVTVKMLFNRNPCIQDTGAIITDLRSIEEAEALKEKGAILIRVDRNTIYESDPIDDALASYDGWTFTIDNNGTIEDAFLETVNCLKAAGVNVSDIIRHAIDEPEDEDDISAEIVNQPAPTQEVEAKQDLIVRDIRGNEWREYDFGGRKYRINNPQELLYRPGGSTHRIIDAEGIVHCIPVPGEFGCVLTWKPRDPNKPVSF
jgi:hypothetical protein